MNKSKITSNNVLFIKLGEGGLWEEGCIISGNLRLGYEDADYNDCLNGNWGQVEKYFLGKGKTQIATSGYITQMKYFFEEPEDTIWITFYNNKLWWTKAKKDVSLENDGTRLRTCIGAWSDKDVSGNVLFMENLSGKLLKTQGFRGTICNVKERAYFLRKINDIESSDVIETKKTYNDLNHSLSTLIKDLTWQDFEVLVDLIFTQAGWQRVSSIGKTAKTLDLDLKAPVTGEKCLVQIKASSSQGEFETYMKKFESMDQYHKFYYICHTFKASNQVTPILDKRIRLMLIDDIAELAIDSGLTKWIIAKVF